MHKFLLVAMLCFMAAPAQAETVYDFVTACKNRELRACFDLIEERLNTLKLRQQGRAFCLPRSWGASFVESTSYPVSVLEHVRVGLSAARFGKAEKPVEDAMQDILSRTFPCKN